MLSKMIEVCPNEFHCAQTYSGTPRCSLPSSDMPYAFSTDPILLGFPECTPFIDSTPCDPSPVQRLPAGLGPVYKFLMLCIHDAALPDALFEDMFISGDVRYFLNLVKQRVTFLQTPPDLDNPSVKKLFKAWKASLDKKRDLVTSLVKVQSELEDYEGDIFALLGGKRIALYHNAYYYWDCFVDTSTTVGKYKDDMSQIQAKPFSWV